MQSLPLHSPQPPDLARRLGKEMGVNVFACYQCKRCSAGCPTAFAMDRPPHELVRALQLGHDELVLTSRTAWLCSSCETCSTRCPQEVDPARVMDGVKVLCERESIAPAVASVANFNRTFVWMISRFGRAYELGLVFLSQLKSGRLWHDLPSGIKLFRKGRLHLLPLRGGRKTVARLRKRLKAATSDRWPVASGR